MNTPQLVEMGVAIGLMVLICPTVLVVAIIPLIRMWLSNPSDSNHNKRG